MAYFWQGFFKTIVFTKIYLFKKIFHTQNKGCTIILVMLWFDEKKYIQCMNVLDYWYYIANEKRYKGQIIHKWIRWRFISQGDLRLEFQEVAHHFFASCFWLFHCIFAIIVVIWCFELLFTLGPAWSKNVLSSHLLHWIGTSSLPSRHFHVFLLSCHSLWVKFFKKNILETCLKPLKSLIMLLLKNKLQVRIEVKCFWNSF